MFGKSHLRNRMRTFSERLTLPPTIFRIGIVLLSIGLLHGKATRAQTTDAEAVQAVCDRLSDSLFKLDLDTAPPLKEPPSDIASVQAYDYRLYRGIAVPIPPNESKWSFILADTISLLQGGDSQIGYLFSDSGEAHLDDALNDWIPLSGWPRPSLGGLALLKHAVAMPSNQWRCKYTSAQEFVNDVTALIVKSLAFSSFDVVYEHDEGLLAHRNHAGYESWRYVFEEETSRRMMTVQIDVYDPLLMPDVGFSLAQETPIGVSAGPGWFSSFFDALNEPNLNSLLLLQKAISDIDLPPETTESLERAISEASE